MKIFSSKPTDPFAEIQKCIREGDYERALGWFRKLLKRDPRNTRIRLRYADAVARTGREDEAVRQYQTVAEELAQAGFQIQALALNKKIVRLDPSQATLNREAPGDATPLNRTASTSQNPIDSSNGSPPSPEPGRLESPNGLIPLAEPSEMRQPRTGPRTHEASEADAQAVPKLDVAHHSDSESDAPSSASVQMSQAEIWAGEPPLESEVEEVSDAWEVEEVSVGSVPSGRPHTEAATEITGSALAGSLSSEDVNDRDESLESARAKKPSVEFELDILIEDVLETPKCDPDVLAWIQEETNLATTFWEDSENLKGERGTQAADEPVRAPLFAGLNARELADAIAWLQPEQTDLAGSSGNDGRNHQGEPAPSGAAELVRVPVFSGLTAQDLAGIARALVRRTVEAGTVILPALDSGDSMIIVSSGEVEVTCEQRGRRVQVATFAKGDFFDELSVLSGLPSGAAVTALANSELLSLNRVDLSALFGLHPAVESQVRQACEERVTENRLMALERRDAMEESEEGRARPKLFDGEWLLKLRGVRTQGGRLVGHVKRAPRGRNGSRAALWETTPSFLVVSAAPAAEVKQSIIPFDGAHLEFTNLAGPRETAKAAKSFTEKFGPLLWDGHYESKLPDGGTDTAIANERTPTRFDWSLPLERFWSEQRRFRFLFRLGVLMTPTHAGTLGRDAPPGPEIRAEVLRILRKNVEAFGEIKRRLIDLTHPVGVFESARKPSKDKSHHSAELARVMDWLKRLEGNVLESPDHWTKEEYLTWLTTAEGVGEILDAARRKSFEHEYGIQEGWKESTEFHDVLDALYFALGEALFGNHGYQLCPKCPRVYHHIEADSDTCRQKCAEAGRKKGRTRKKPKDAHRRKPLKAPV